MQFGEFDCGCDGRKEIMGSGGWQLDAGVIGAVAVLVVILILVKVT